MTFFKTITAATAIAALSTTSFAGGLSPQIMEAPVVVEEDEMMAPATSSISPTYIVIGVLGALAIAALLQEDDDEEPEDDNTPVILPIDDVEIIEGGDTTGIDNVLLGN